MFTGKTKQNKKYVIRYPLETDAKNMYDYIDKLSQERTFIRFQRERISLEDETKYLRGQLEKIKNRKTVQLIVLLDKKLPA